VRTTDYHGLDVICPYCYGVVIRARSLRDQVPHKGDYAFCSRCGEIGVFTDRTAKRRGVAVRKSTPQERLRAVEHPDIAVMRQNWMRR
jgi:hypothetical protein